MVQTLATVDTCLRVVTWFVARGNKLSVLAVNVNRIYGFTDEDFGKFHPAGALGEKLPYHVKDVMMPAEDITIFDLDISLRSHRRYG